MTHSNYVQLDVEAQPLKFDCLFVCLPFFCLSAFTASVADATIQVQAATAAVNLDSSYEQANLFYEQSNYDYNASFAAAEEVQLGPYHCFNKSISYCATNDQDSSLPCEMFVGCGHGCGRGDNSPVDVPAWSRYELASCPFPRRLRLSGQTSPALSALFPSSLRIGCWLWQWLWTCCSARVEVRRERNVGDTERK